MSGSLLRSENENCHRQLLSIVCPYGPCNALLAERLPSGMLRSGVRLQPVSCLTRRVCCCNFERSELRKHSDVGLEPDLNVVRLSPHSPWST